MSWQRSHPDPALTDPDRPGLRAHRHPPDRLHAWVFLQHQIWVDDYGNEHEIESMELAYVAAVIGLCQRQAGRILLRVGFATVKVAAECAADGDFTRAEQLIAEAAETPVEECDAVEWLEGTPLMVALRRRLAAGGPSS